MPNFDDNKNNSVGDSQSPDLNNPPSSDLSGKDNVSLFDLTKKEDERSIAENIPIQKTTSSQEKSQEISKPTTYQENILKDSHIEESLPTSREEAQNNKISTNFQAQPEVSQSVQDTSIPHIQKTPEKQSISQNEPIIKNQSKRKTIWLIAKFILYIIGSFVFVYLFLNFPALWSKLTYNLKEKTGQKPQVQTIIPADTDEDLLFLSTVNLYDTPTNNESKNEVKRGPTKDELGLNGIANNELWIPKLDVKAPIVWDSPVDEATMMENLKHGVVHYQGTTKPGEKAQDGEGNIFISGHSSYYWWDDGNYKTIFANLDQIEVGDEIGIGYDDYGYVYRVVEKKIVNPDQTDVLNQDTDKNTLSLMTCYPVGTNNQRMIVKAEFIARGKDEPEIIKEEVDKEMPSPTPTASTPAPASTPLITQSPVAPNSSSKNFDVLEILPWNW